MKYFNRIFITGDTHGDYSWLQDFCYKNNTSKEDLLIILGDTGINFCQPPRLKDIAMKERIKKCPITLFCICGNHDIRPEDYKPDFGVGYELINITRMGDPIWIDLAYPNIWFAKDGGCYFMNGYSFLTIGGAYSVDKEYRKKMHWIHYDNEVLSQEEQDDILKNMLLFEDGLLPRIHYDFVLTHTAPLENEPTHLFMKGIDQSKVDKSMEKFLSKIKANINYSYWFFGHYHADEKIEPNMFMLYNHIMQINNSDTGFYLVGVKQ